MSKKTALEQALLESNEILKIVTDNAKDMLYAQLKPELEKTIKESLELNDDDKDLDDAPSEEPSALDITSTEPESDIPSELPVDGDKADTTVTDEPAADNIAIDSPEDDEIDLTGASDDEVIKVFKKLSDDSEIKIVKTGDGINIEKDGEEFIVKLNEDFKEMYNDKPSMEEEKMDFVDSIEENEIIYEIVMDEEEGDVVPTNPADVPNDNEQSIEEVARTHADGRHMERKPEGFYKYASSRLRPALKEEKVAESAKELINEAVLLKEANDKLITENANLKNEVSVQKKDLEAHRDALRSLKENLMEVALVNSQMAYVNRVFCEHSTTLDEKKAIIDRFSDAKTIDEAKTLFKTISNEMKNIKVTIQEEIENKINTSVSSTGEPLLEQQNIQESENQKKIDRIKFLMNSNYYK